jgi:heme/copper-type cytochrome/quinol oxidase subunit 2
MSFYALGRCQLFTRCSNVLDRLRFFSTSSAHLVHVWLLQNIFLAVIIIIIIIIIVVVVVVVTYFENGKATAMDITDSAVFWKVTVCSAVDMYHSFTGHIVYMFKREDS